MNTQTLTFEQFVKAPPSQVYHAFTNATALREWMCDIATVSPHPSGRLYMAWNSGFYMAGEYVALKPDQAVTFTWFGRGEPTPTQVSVTLTEKDGGTLVRLAHEQVGEGQAWENTVKEIRQGWGESLENLASTLETGHDLRFTLRPMLGIALGDFNAELAGKLGVPVSEGIRLDGVVDGMGAQVAGLQANDVIIGLAGCVIKTYPDLPNALQGKRAGNRVEVIFYRGGEQMTTIMELSRRPLPEIPATIPELAEAVRLHYKQMEEELDQFFVGVSEDDASFQPAPDEWCVKEVLAHLIQGENSWHQRIAELVGSQESWADEYPGNQHFTTRATVIAYPSLNELLAHLRQQFAETCALFTNLPEQFVERKSTYWRLAYEALQTAYHLNTHIAQMRAAIETSRAIHQPA